MTRSLLWKDSTTDQTIGTTPKRPMSSTAGDTKSQPAKCSRRAAGRSARRGVLGAGAPRCARRPSARALAGRRPLRRHCPGAPGCASTCWLAGSSACCGCALPSSTAWTAWPRDRRRSSGTCGMFGRALVTLSRLSTKTSPRRGTWSGSSCSAGSLVSDSRIGRWPVAMAYSRCVFGRGEPLQERPGVLDPGPRRCRSRPSCRGRRWWRGRRRPAGSARRSRRPC